MRPSIYPRLYTTLIRRTDPERAHHLGVRAIGLAGATPLLRRLMSATIGHLDPRSRPARVRDDRRDEVRIGSRVVPGRLGLAAGMDKEARAVLGMSALGFAFIEIGTVTPLAQPGNDAPRLWRHVEEGALRNRMGFNNDGAAAVASRLRRLRSTRAGRSVIVGANIGKNKVTPEHLAAEDYRTCARLLAPWVDFIVVNVSSPNTPGLRDLQATDHLRPILEAARAGCEEAVERHVPILVKIAPDLDDEAIVDIVRLAKEIGLDGMVATNTTIRHDHGEGGLSGVPLFGRALEVVRLVADHLDDTQLLIAAGGITTVEDAEAMLDAGADLVEAFTAFVAQGPAWPGEMNRALAAY